jgi:hypothetical protein
MTGWDDLPDEMRGERIDEGTLDRLLRGHVPPDDAPPGYSDVASVLLAAASQPTPEELSMQAHHVLAAQDAIIRRTRHRRPGPLGLAASAIVVAALLILPGLAVANVLRGPTQAPAATTTSDAGGPIQSTGAPSAPGGSGAHPASTGSDISSVATTTDATGVAKGAEISSLASGGKSQAGQHGKPAGAAPPVDTPNTGGTGTGDTASGGAAGNGASAADDHSGGHSAAGSGNAASNAA